MWLVGLRGLLVLGVLASCWVACAGSCLLGVLWFFGSLVLVCWVFFGSLDRAVLWFLCVVGCCWLADGGAAKTGRYSAT